MRACHGAATLTVESYNCRLRDEYLNEHQFANLRDARDLISAWR
ncbi:transposase [Rhodovulum sulfidophilum]|uniref:Transposase n=1 Tax=Rhodovulum sulfidophilum TaxID=35806 RepID=A0ABS1RT26_RHOSU|nr:transposase [Rhodovulum sulfidophilum]